MTELKGRMKVRIGSHVGKRNSVRLVTIILFAVMFCAGLLTTFSYGQPWDENVEIDILISDIKEYAARVGIDENIPVLRDFGHIPRISTNIDRDHGLAAYYLFFPVLLKAGYQTGSAMQAWHVNTFLIYFAGLIAFFLILRELFSKPVAWFGGTLSYFLTPRFFAESHYNCMDLVFVSFLLLMLLCLIRVTKSMTWKNVLLYAIFSGFLMNIRVLGIAFWAFGGFFSIVYQIIKKRKTDVCIKMACGFLLSAAVWFLLTPAAWQDPGAFLRYCMDNATGFSRWNRVILFNGNMIRPSVNGLPYSYLPKWMLMTIPEHVLLLFAASCAGYLIRIMIRLFRWKKHQISFWSISDRAYFTGMLMLFFWVPFAYLVYRSPTIVLYNGWRHCYFLYPPLILSSTYVIESCSWRRKWDVSLAKSCLLCGVLLLGLVSALTDILVYHPYEYVYFNRVSRRLFQIEGFEGDYWNVATIDSLRRFEARFPQDHELKVALMVDAGGGQTESLLNSERIRVVNEEDADYFLFNVSALNDRSMLNGYELVSGIERNGYLISGVYIKKNN